MKPEYIGAEKGKYHNINIAWETGLEVDEEDREKNSQSDLGNEEYRYACDNGLFDIIKEFSPDIILISCGFDGALNDPLGWSRLTAI